MGGEMEFSSFTNEILTKKLDERDQFWPRFLLTVFVLSDSIGGHEF